VLVRANASQIKILRVREILRYRDWLWLVFGNVLDAIPLPKSWAQANAAIALHDVCARTQVLYIILTAAMVLSLRMDPSIKQTYDSKQDSLPYLRVVVLPCCLLTVATTALGLDDDEPLLLQLHRQWFNIAWTFSVLLEAVALLPQLLMTQVRKMHTSQVSTWCCVVNRASCWRRCCRGLLSKCWEFIIFELLWLGPALLTPHCNVFSQRYREVENLTIHYISLVGAYRALYILNWIHRSRTEDTYRHNWVVYRCAVVHVAVWTVFFMYYFCCAGAASSSDSGGGGRVSSTKAPADIGSGGGGTVLDELTQPLMQTV
jgi:ER lumen protein retaining receptor